MLNALVGFLREPRRFRDALELSDLAPGMLSRARGQASQLAAALESDFFAERCEVVKAVIQRIVLSGRSVSIELNHQALLAQILASEDRDEDFVSLKEPVLLEVVFTPVRRGVETRLVINGEKDSDRAAPDLALIKAIARGHCWFEKLAGGDFGSMRELARAEGVSERFVAQQMELAFLAPTFVNRILDAEPFSTASAKRLALTQLPLLWPDQLKLATGLGRLRTLRFRGLC